MSFQKNVIESFKKAKEDMIRINTTLEHLIKEQQELNKKVDGLMQKQAVTEEKLKVLSKK